MIHVTSFTPPLWMRPAAIALLSTALGTALSGCAAHSWNTAAAPQSQPAGVEVARAEIISGPGIAGAPLEIDCAGPGLGVRVLGPQQDMKEVFDAQGEPCGTASVLFDGRTPQGQRAADPTISLRFHDALGTLLDERPVEVTGENRRARKAVPADSITERLQRLGTPLMPEEPAAQNALEPGAGPLDPLQHTLQRWQSADAQLEARSEARWQDNERQLTQMVRRAEAASSGEAAALLAARLRERERNLQEEQRRHSETRARSQQNRAVTQAARDAWQREQARLEQDLEASRMRAAEFERLAARLQQEKQRKEEAFTTKISALSRSLEVAEAQADANRRELLLQAAAKVAEAQALATAARIDSQSAQLAEATALHAKANSLMDEVLANRSGLEDIEPAAGPATPTPILEAPIFLQAKERTLPEMLDEVLQQAAPHSGAWRADWQLGTAAQKILTERWSLTAEATVRQILENLQQQVQQAHGVRLQFTPFPQTRVLVITEIK